MEQEAKSHHRVRNTIIVVAVILLLAFIGGELLVVTLREEADRGEAALGGTTVDETALPATMSFELVAGHIVIDAVLEDGDDPVALILDTGAPTIISDELAEQLGVEIAGTINSATIDGTVVTDDIVTIPEVRIGDVTFSDAGSIKGFLEREDPLSCISSNGLIGASLMKTGVWQIDFGTGQVTIASGVDGLDHIDGAVVLDFETAGTASPSPILRIGSGDGALVFLVDTGSDASLVVNPGDLAAIGVEVEDDVPNVTLVGAGAAGSFDTQARYAAVDLELWSQRLDDFPISTIESLPAGQGNMGTAFMQNYVVTVDWPQSNIYLDPLSPDPQPVVPPAASLGWDGTRITVGSVVEESDAAEAGLSLNEPIASVEGADVTAAARDDFCELHLATKLDDEYALTVDGGQSYQIGPVEDFYDPLQES